MALLGAKKHLEVGWGLEMTLVFKKAGEVVIDAAIDAPDAKHAHDVEAMERWEKAHNKAEPESGSCRRRTYGFLATRTHNPRSRTLV